MNSLAGTWLGYELAAYGMTTLQSPKIDFQSPKSNQDSWILKKERYSPISGSEC